MSLSRAHRLPRVDARNHYPRIKHHTPPPKPGATTRLPPHTVARETRACCLKAQQCAWWPAPRNRGNQKILFAYAPELAPLRIRPVTGDESIQRIVQITELPQSWAGLNLVVLLRKEVIQPHLPVRLPCYDFVPIADPTFDGSLHKG